MSLPTHDHRLWALIGIYTGREDNILWRRADRGLEAYGAKVLFAGLLDAMDHVRSREMGQTAEVALSIIRILEALRRRAPVSWDEAREVLDMEGLAAYLARNNPAQTRVNEGGGDQRGN